MNLKLARRASRALTLMTGTIAAAAAFAGPASATIDSPDDCSTQQMPAIFQPFLAYRDYNWYFMAPGGDFASPTAVASAGWKLSGGAAVVPAVQQNGVPGYVLDLPSGAKAVTPVMCVTKDYPIARMFVRNLAGSEGVTFSVSYARTSTWEAPRIAGTVRGGANQWQLTPPVSLQAYSLNGWQLVKFTFVPGGTTSRFQISDLWVDPRMY